MSKKFYLLFSEVNVLLKPKIYKRLACAQKYLIQNSEWKIKEFYDEFSANNALQMCKLTQQKLKLLLKNQMLNHQNPKLQKINQQTHFLQTSESDAPLTLKQKLTLQYVEENFPKIQTRMKIQKQISRKTIQELQKQKQKILALSPVLPKLLHYHSVSQVSHNINPADTYSGFFDGCSKGNPGLSGVGYYLTDNKKIILDACFNLGYKTNNQAEFSALLYLMVDAYINGIRKIDLFGDSKLAIQTFRGQFKIQSVNLLPYDEGINKVLSLFEQCKFEFIRRLYNARADDLANKGASKKYFKTEKKI